MSIQETSRTVGDSENNSLLPTNYNPTQSQSTDLHNEALYQLFIRGHNSSSHFETNVYLPTSEERQEENSSTSVYSTNSSIIRNIRQYHLSDELENSSLSNASSTFERRIYAGSDSDATVLVLYNSSSSEHNTTSSEESQNQANLAND